MRVRTNVTCQLVRGATLVIVTIGSLLTFQGCGTKNADNAKSVDNGPEVAAVDGSGAKEAAVVNAPATSGVSKSGAGQTANVSQGAAPPKAAEKPSAEQIAKWAIPEFEPLRLLACSDGFGDPAVFSMVISPDGKQFVLGGARLTVWNTGDPQPIVNLLEKYSGEEFDRPVRAVALSSDGKWLAAGDQKGTVKVWTLADQRELISIPAHQGHVSQLAFSPNRSLLASTSYSGDVNLWQMPEGKKLKSLKMSKQEINRLVFVSDSLLASASNQPNIWNVESGEKVSTLEHEYVRSPALGLSRDRRWLAFNDANSVVQCRNLENKTFPEPTLLGAGASIIDFSPDGKWIATYSGDSTIRIWDAATGNPVQVIDADGERTWGLGWLPDSKSFIVSTELARVRIWGTPESAKTLGIEPLQLPTVEPLAAGAHKAMTPPQLHEVIDVRSFPRLPGALPMWGDHGMFTYGAPVTQKEAELFYRHYLTKAGWTEAPPSPDLPGLQFHKQGCEVNISLRPAYDGPPTKRSGDLQVSIHFAGNYDVRWLPKFAAIDSKSNWSSFSSVSYRTKADLTDVEVALLKQLHEAGWTAYTRLDASSNEESDSRILTLLQGGSMLNVSIGRPTDAKDEFVVQFSISVSNKSLPIPPDAGWIEFDASTDLKAVINTKMDLEQTTQFFDKQMAAEGWLAREAGRKLQEDRGWLPYIRGQQDIYLRLIVMSEGGTRIIIGDAAHSSWQLQDEAKAGDKKTAENPQKPGVEAADFKLPAGAQEAKFDVDQKKIEFEVAGSTPAKQGEQFVAQMESLGWKRESAGVISDEYVFITFSKERAEIQIRARAAPNKATAMISGDGLLWAKPLPAPPVRISYGIWLRRHGKKATLDLLDEFSAEMHKIPAPAK